MIRCCVCSCVVSCLAIFDICYDDSCFDIIILVCSDRCAYELDACLFTVGFAICMLCACTRFMSVVFVA